ncbi:hypothetical protein [Pedobacter frigoris]|uniref:Uncharacterized protein n=1 Tax=Pedobacter frigoris TaxID=2571272 RepID=A0A4U1CFJ5_9SPHI|nr:hypothetical protein [Pedobacter frigoris]TKC05858.1 hypothetical protein FA047_10965 [Pedobacter frigoris]
MNNLKLEYLAKGNLTNSLELADLLGKEWEEEMIRYAYDVVIKLLLEKYKSKIVDSIIGIEGKTTLTLVDNQYYLFENIDIWTHEVYATDELMSLIVNEINKMLKQSNF